MSILSERIYVLLSFRPHKFTTLFIEARKASFGIAWSKPQIYQKRFRQAKRDFGNRLFTIDICWLAF
jgi:hypothetical protein